jgi:hypothetical protein
MNGMVGRGHGRGMASVNQTRPRCVNQMGNTHSKPLAARHGRGTAWSRHAMCESAFSVMIFSVRVALSENPATADFRYSVFGHCIPVREGQEYNYLNNRPICQFAIQTTESFNKQTNKTKNKTNRNKKQNEPKQTFYF